MAHFSSCRLLYGFVLFSFWTLNTNGQANMCGVPQPDPMKTCVSIRLPWQPEPMYFCVEKEKFKYRSQCLTQTMNNCGLDMRQDTLLVATPWDCCPMSSVPDHCYNAGCPPMPMNRTCKLLDMNMIQYNNMYGDCCQKYFCEENSTPEDCHFKRLQPDCINPPKDKMNCVGFIDPYGCCTKYQCQNEGKPGMCPMEAQAKHFSGRMMNLTGSMPMNNGAPATRNTLNAFSGSSTSNIYMRAVPPPVSNNNGRGPTILRMQQQQYPSTVSRTLPDSMTMTSMYQQMIPCVGDFNCGGTHKCCSSDLNVYGDGAFVMKNPNPTYGYCTEPIMMPM